MSSRLSSLVICAHSTVVRHTLTIAASAAASHLPATNATRGAGLTSSGSSDPRSRSPAVESVAICMPPAKPAIMMNIGMNVRICAARCCALETSISSIASGRDGGRADAARDQAQAADLGAVALQAGGARAAPSAARRCASCRRRVCSGAGRDDRNLSAKSSGTITTTVFALLAHRLLRPRPGLRRSARRPAVAASRPAPARAPCRRRECGPLRPRAADRRRVFIMKPMRTGPIDHAEQDRPQRAAIAQRVLQLLAADDERSDAVSASRSLVRSSIEAGERHERVLEILWPVCRAARRACRGRRRVPRAITTIESQSADTSCMTWLENSTQRPSSRSRRMIARTARVLITSRPLVGSSSSTFCGSCTSARASADLGALAVREAGGAAIGDRVHVEQVEQFLGSLR